MKYFESTDKKTKIRVDVGENFIYIDQLIEGEWKRAYISYQDANEVFNYKNYDHED